jgi:hypothetical protein
MACRQAYNSRMDTRRIVLALIAAIAAIAVMGVAPPAPAASSCEASVHAELTHVEPKELVTTHTYDVNVTTLEPCATIRFTLYTTERISKTKVKVVKTPGEVRVRQGSLSRILNYDLKHGREMVKWEVKLTGCERCEP